ncbi:MAG: hypothetical protein GY952_07295 [Rhodobacteraceae bacterium]|nr:hypothetical protein [Paracoccaceae bacterium]
MFGWVRLGVIGLVLLTVIYVCLSWYSKSIRREKLEQEFDAGGIDGERDTFIAEGLKQYDGSLRKKLIWGVYVIPVIAVLMVIYVTNFM